MKLDPNAEEYARALDTSQDCADVAPALAPLVAIAEALRPTRPINMVARNAAKATMLATFATAQAAQDDDTAEHQVAPAQL